MERKESQERVASASDGADVFGTGGEGPPLGGPGLQPGSLFAGRYRLAELIGEGGMGQVYRVLDTLREEEVALKILHPHLGGHPDSRKRFLRELKVTERLNHPGIVRVLGLDQDPETQTLCLVMKLIKGESLESILEPRPKGEPAFALEKILKLLEELAGILDYAHGQGVIHRDLKPSNVMVLADNSLRLLDFGIARAMQSEEQTQNTSVGWGSAYYMAPEQLEGGDISTKADIFAFGIIAYRMLLGALPVGLPKKPSAVIPGLSSSFDDALFRAMEPEPEARYETAGAFVRALRAASSVTHHLPSPPPPSKMPYNRPVAPPRPARTSLDSVSAGAPPVLHTPEKKPDTHFGKILLVLLLLVGVGVFIGFLSVGSDGEVSERERSRVTGKRPGFSIRIPSIRIPSIRIPAIRIPSIPGVGVGQGERRGTFEIPVTWLETTQGKGLKLETRRSWLNAYPGLAFYNIKAILSNTGSSEIQKIRGTLLLKDAKGNVLKSSAVRILDTYQPALRPGDRHGIHQLVRARREIQSAVFRVDYVEKTPIHGAFAPSKEIKAGWLFQKPGHVGLSIRERSLKISSNSFMGGHYVTVVWEIKNTGQSSLKSLKCRVQLFDTKERLLNTKEFIIAYSSTPAIYPGETRLRKTIAKVARPVAHYKFLILEAE